mmetsp:Transcript_27805/g.55683  ORF Transcript_27805/g.55683 Transcript_27805/m.55683 type:complete len:390 (+) Transcript_27805:339-1508(+)
MMVNYKLRVGISAAVLLSLLHLNMDTNFDIKHHYINIASDPREEKEMESYMMMSSTSDRTETITYTNTNTNTIADPFYFENQKYKTKQEQKLRYCELGSSKTSNDSIECYNLLSSHLSSKPAWHFLGDSQMGMLMTKVLSEYPYKISKKKVASERCGFLDYCQLEKCSEWIPSSKNKTQGPFMFGLEHPFCSDLSWFRNNKVETETENIGDGIITVSSIAHKFTEYLVVEYASDVEQQSKTTKTTQQSVTLYMEQNLKDHNLSTIDSICIVNTGLHDQHMCNYKTEVDCLDAYRTNVQEYLRLLDRVCGNIVWISTTPVANDVGNIQNNNRTLEWNKAVKSLLETYYVEKSFYVDTWKRALNYTHTDNVHFKVPYYTTVANLFKSIIKY